MRHILVATDFSDASAAALHHAVELAAGVGAKVTLLHVIFSEKITEELLGLDALAYLSRGVDAPPEETPYAPSQAVARLREASQRQLDQTIAAIPAIKAKMDTALAEGRPSTEIVNFANKNGVDLIVMGTHGRGAVGRAFLGSVADKVIRQAECPVMVVRKMYKPT